MLSLRLPETLGTRSAEPLAREVNGARVASCGDFAGAVFEKAA
jgi:hypothetical protein